MVVNETQSPLLCVQTLRDLCIFGCTYRCMFWRVIYEWTIELTVIDATMNGNEGTNDKKTHGI